ncbi:MAG: dephospho-CoA kinase [Bdellovibrionota bacterium]
MVKLIAITGGIGSGKSTVSKILTSLGYCVFDADVFAREVLFYSEIESRIKSIFGSHVFIETGVLNRALIRKMIYEAPHLKKQLESILHPAIAEELKIKSQCLNKIASNAWVFYEASIILENGRKNHFDACVVVTAKQELKIKRLTHSRSLSEEDIHKIISTQMPDEEKITLADYVIENSGDFKNLEQNTFSLIKFLHAKFTPAVSI